MNIYQAWANHRRKAKLTGRKVNYSSEELKIWYLKNIKIFNSKYGKQTTELVRKNNLVDFSLDNLEIRGPLKTIKINKRFYQLWEAQRKRCLNKNEPAYKNYGGKGIIVEYTGWEFVCWCKDNVDKKLLNSRFCIGRIDHSKNYTLDNIQVETGFQSTSERNSRYGNPGRTKPVRSIDFKSEKILKEFSTIKEAAMYYSMTPPRVIEYCKGKRTKRHDGITFRYVD